MEQYDLSRLDSGDDLFGQEARVYSLPILVVSVPVPDDYGQLLVNAVTDQLAGQEATRRPQKVRTDSGY